MPQFFSNKRLIILMVSIIVLVALVGYSLSDREKITWPEQVMRDTVSWVETLFSRPAQYVAGFFENVKEIHSIYEENKILKARLEEYAEVAVERNLLREENETLRKMVDIDESLRDYKMRPALVIHRSPDRWGERVGINRGSSHGIERNMAVITAEGLIGKVQSVSQFSSSVQLLTDQDRTNRVSAMIHSDKPVYGFIESYDDERDLLLMKKIDADSEFKEGDLVTSSGLGGVFPQGLVIGEVVEIVPDEYGLTKNAYIEPAANFYGLDYVYVIERSSTVLADELLELEEDDQ